jgi:hypothetical protein
MKTISEEYLHLQKELHSNPNYGVASLQMAPIVKKIFEDSNFISISDYGAGKKNLEKGLLKLGLKNFEYYPYDPAFPEYGLPKEADIVCCIDVLEHIEDDVTELSLAKELLRPSGFVIIVVPAHQWLYARVDQLTGHFRRYSKRTMTNVVSSSGLTLHNLRYFDSVGLVPYLVLYKWLRNVSTSGTNATIYSRVIMPISYMIFVLFRGRLLGKNLVAIAGASAAG